MPTAKIAITLEEDFLKEIDRWVSEGRYPNRSKAIQETLKGKITDWRRKRLVEEVSKLNPKEEQALAEEALFSGNEIWDEEY
ncbi:MAG: CopG family transcriptional regulator [Deltaproteobacteria bacterium]|nr:MAG: CopG family transcriptional regulator [Deltaproteobacteria bacterium]